MLDHRQRVESSKINADTLSTFLTTVIDDWTQKKVSGEIAPRICDEMIGAYSRAVIKDFQLPTTMRELKDRVTNEIEHNFRSRCADPEITAQTFLKIADHGYERANECSRQLQQRKRVHTDELGIETINVFLSDVIDVCARLKNDRKISDHGGSDRMDGMKQTMIAGLYSRAMIKGGQLPTSLRELDNRVAGEIEQFMRISPTSKGLITTMCQVAESASMQAEIYHRSQRSGFNR